MKPLLAILALITVVNSCIKKTTIPSIPSCIQYKIDELKSKPKYNPPAKVVQYEYNGEPVYYITSNCCDQYNELYDDDCKYICAPDGGITGAGDYKCTDFNTKKKNEKIIWQDPR